MSCLNSIRKRTKLSSNVPSVYSHGHPIMAAAAIISNQTAQATSHLFHSTPLTLHIRSASLTHLSHEFLSFIFLVQDKRHLEIKKIISKKMPGGDAGSIASIIIDFIIVVQVGSYIQENIIYTIYCIIYIQIYVF